MTQKPLRQLLDQSWNSVNTIDIGLDFKYVDSVLDSADFNPEDWSILLASHAATALDVIDQLLKSQSNSRLESVEVGLSFFFNDLASFLIESGLGVGMLLEDITPTIASSELWTSEVAIHTEMIVIVIDESVDDKVCKANLQAFSQSRLHILE